MKQNKILYLILAAFLVTSCSNDEDKSLDLKLTHTFPIADTVASASNEDANVVFLFGQSNATGCTQSQFLEQNDKEIFDKYKLGFDNTYTNFVCENFNNASMRFTNTQLGQAASIGHFGPEVGIAEKLNNSSKKTFIIKYTYGGTTLHNQWLDGKGNRGGLYNCSVEFSNVCMNYLIAKGYKLNVLGICWMQGENDAVYDLQNKYFSNTEKLVSYYRTDFKKYQNDIRFVDAKISEVWSHYEQINEAKTKFTNSSSNNFLIDTIELGLTTKNEPKDTPDIAHYDSISMVKLGRAFGEFLLK